MFRLNPSIAFLASISYYASFVEAAPELAFPINSQVPPVAHASKAYSYQFSSSTFRSDGQPLSYSLVNAPQWLSLDTSGRMLQGTPSLADVGPAAFDLTAADEDGQTPSSVILMVLDRPNIQAGESIVPCLQDTGPVSAPSSLLLRPLQPFRISVGSGTFTGTSGSTTYYAISADNSPLPPWIQFNNESLSFLGSSPPLVSPSAAQQSYGIQLIATDVAGFAEAIVDFHIAISYHILSFSQPTATLNVTSGKPFQSEPLRDTLTLDGKPVDSNKIASVTADLPPWASLDLQSISIRGTPPTDFQSETITFSVRDIFEDQADFALAIRNEQILLGGETQFVNLTVVSGQYFSYNIGQLSLRSLDNVSADLGNAVNWLSFSTANFTLHGLVPAPLKQQTLQIIIATGNEDATDLVTIRLNILASAPATTTMPTNGPTDASPSSTTTKGTDNSNVMAQPPAGNHTTPRHIVAVVLTPVLLIFAAIVLIIFLLCWKRKREKRNGLEAQKELSARASFAEEAVPDTIDLPPVAEESRISSGGPRQMTPVQVPKVELPWAPDSLPKAKNRLSRRMRLKNQGSIDSSWGELLVPPKPRGLSVAQDEDPGSSHPLPGAVIGPPRIPDYSAKRQRRLSKQKPLKSERGSKILSTTTNHTIGLPNRLSGAGHGAGMLAASTMASLANRSSWQTLASIPQGDARLSITTLDAFPPPPADDKENRDARMAASITKPSMRLVEPSSDPSDSLDLQRQRWYTERAKERLEGVARFSNAGSSRTTSFSRIPNAVRSPSRTISPTIPENGTIKSRLSQQPWSNWSGIGPTMRTESAIDVRAPAPLFTQQSSRAVREVSMASSGQFDSALSSDSHWEDENLIAEVNDNGERHWQTDTESAQPSPRLPFEPFSGSSHEEIGQAPQAGVSRGARLIDKRKHVGVEDENLRRSEKSQAGSFRFI